MLNESPTHGFAGPRSDLRCSLVNPEAIRETLINSEFRAAQGCCRSQSLQAIADQRKPKPRFSPPVSEKSSISFRGPLDISNTKGYGPASAARAIGNADPGNQLFCYIPGMAPERGISRCRAVRLSCGLQGRNALVQGRMAQKQLFQTLAESARNAKSGELIRQVMGFMHRLKPP